MKVRTQIKAGGLTTVNGLKTINNHTQSVQR